MTDEQQEKKPTQKFASIKQQFETIGGSQDVETSKRYDAPAMKRQTVYMPSSLARWLKIHAAMTNTDISSVITGLVAKYKDEVEKK
jgi:hypothetical protein